MLISKFFKATKIRIYWIYNLLKLNLKRIKTDGKVYIAGHINIENKGTCSFGKNLTILSGNDYNPLSRNISSAIVVRENAKLIIGDNVGISSSSIWVYDFVLIGDNVKIGADCIIMDSDAHSTDYLNRREPTLDMKKTKNAGIKIGGDVLIGTRCIILKGVSIGDRTIIGAGSIVTKSIPSDCIAGGNPCKIISQKTVVPN